MNPITEELRTFVVDNFLFGQAGDGLPEDASFIDRGIIDSTGVLELISFLERRYAIRLEDDEIVPENLDSLGRLTRFVERKLAAQILEVAQ
jgi:acyl carrier protein